MNALRRPTPPAAGVLALAVSWGLASATAATTATANPAPVPLPGWVTDWVDTCSTAGSATPASGAGDASELTLADSSGCALWFLVRAPIDLSELIEQDRPVRRALRLARRTAERSLVRLRPGEEQPQIFAADLDPELRLTALDLDGRGALEPVLIGPGSLQQVRVSGEEVVLSPLALPDAEGRGVAPPASAEALLASFHPRAQLLAWPEVGRVRFFRLRRGSPARFESLDVLPLPTDVSVASSVFELRSPTLRRVEVLSGPSAATAFASEPIVVAPGRWKVLLLEPGTVDGERVREVWLRTPEVERPIWSRFLSFEGDPLLVVQTLRDDRVGMVERKKLRIYRLRADRTRAGIEPLFAEQTASRLWQQLDVDLRAGNGQLTLTLLQREGFDGKKTLVSRYDGTLDRLARSRPRSVVIKTPWPNWTWGHDLDGDGLGDLLLASASLQLHAGVAGGRAPFERRPSWSQALPEAGEVSFESTLEIADEQAGAEIDAERATGEDVDGDGAPEQINWGPAHVVGPSSTRTLMLIGARGRSARGGAHLVLRVAPPR